jgi:hypothetical protein
MDSRFRFNPQADKVHNVVQQNRILWVFLAAAATLGIATWLPKIVRPNSVTVSVEMKSHAGNRIELYINDLLRPAYVQPIVEGQRRVYTFADIRVNDISLFRLDPTHGASDDVRLYSVRIRDQDGPVVSYGPESLTKWRTYNARPLPPDDGAFHLQCLQSEVVMYAPTPIPIRRHGIAALNDLVAALEHPDLATDVLVLGLFFMLVSCLSDQRRLPHLFLLPAIILAGLATMQVTMRSVKALDSVDKAVGRASFTGLSTRAQEAAVVMASLAACGLAMLTYFLWRWVAAEYASTSAPAKSAKQNRIRLGASDALLAQHEQSRGKTSKFSVFWLPAIAVVFFALVNCPDIRGIAVSMISGVAFTPQWDANNFVYWSYLVHKGYLPYKDFWYPYSGFYLFDSPLPTGPLIQWAYRTLLYSAIFYAFYKILRRKFWVAFIGATIAMLGDWIGLFENGYRYLLAVAVLFAYLAIDHEERKITDALVLFWVTCAISFFFEPMQLTQAAIAIIVLLSIELYRSSDRSGRNWMARFGREFAVPLASVFVVLGLLAARGELSGFSKFYLGAGDSAAYGAIPTDVSWLRNAFTWSAFQHLTEYPAQILFGAAVLIGIGLFERLRARGRANRYADALLGLGIIYLLVLQKHLIRPMPNEFLLYLMTALFVYVAFVPWKRRRLELAATGVVVGTILSAFIANGGANKLLTQFQQSFKNMPGNVATLSSDKDLLCKANLSYFALPHFQQFADEQAVATRIRATVPSGGNDEAFVLSDDPMIYILTGQPGAVYYPNLYNASPIYEQALLVRWLNSDRPSFVVFDPAELMFDGFQKAVRLPLVFSAVASSYVPAETIGRFQLLRRRQSGQPTALSYWREKLGSEIDFGHLAQISSFHSLKPCSDTSKASCAPFLQITYANPCDAKVAIPFEVSGLTFSAAFNSIAGRSVYYIPLDRCWPWRVAADAALPKDIMCQKLPPGISVQIIHKQVPTDVLY